ncbi:uncharacterized protein, partial [Brachionichthys hirsutus]|uniref:uncharacterized protein n=1 Tax=Brachionichthys hirsutus TaxID=412623 RepID=UPI003604A0ED
MNSPRDAEPGPFSRKHRLMAAAVPGEDSPLPGNTSRSDRNGPGGPVHCFVCGSGVTPGRELRLPVTYQKERTPFFPFLQNQEAAPGACELSPDGHALVCAVCHCFLTEQWNSFERSRAPVEKRMYWLKRPYQCDSRRVPQEWNVSYDLDRRVGAGGVESDFSSFSDNENMSEQEMDLLDRAAKDKSPRTSGKSSGDSGRKSSVIKRSPDSQRLMRYPVGVYGARGSPEAEAERAPPPRLGAKVMKHVCQSTESETQDGPLSDAPGRDNGVITHSKPWLEEGGAGHAEPRQSRGGRGGGRPDAAPSSTGPAGKRNAAAPRERKSDSCEEEEEETRVPKDDGADAGGATAFRLHRDLSARKGGQVTHSGCPGEWACYICGSGLKHGGLFKVSVQKQERARGEPFFPFLWLHAPPQGAMPINPAGTTLVCGGCHSSLTQQWQSFQHADVPVLQRLYVVPFNQGAAPLHPSQISPRQGRLRESTDDSRAPPEACFLCGQEHGGDVRVAYAQAGVGKSRGAMYFPFISMLPRPPNAQAARNGGVRCCRHCHFILEEIWNAYRLSLSEDLITSISSFLIRYHAATPAEGSGPTRWPQAGVASHGAVSACYLCGAELRAGGEHQLQVNPPGHRRDKEPFFPFLTVHPPAPRAKPVDATGLVSACNLCYHDLHTQWGQHESNGPAPSGANLQAPSSPWARQYSCEAFVCFFCRQEQRRLGRLCAVTVARLPVFLYAPRSPRTLLVDDGRKLVIGSCVECKALVQVGQNWQQEGNRLRHGALDGEREEPESASPQSGPE